MAAGVERDASQATGNNLSSPAIVLLPGLDGSGELFSELVSELPSALTVVIGKYPNKRFLSYKELIPVVKEIVPNDDPFIIVAESFSTPLATMFAATHPPNLVGLVMCAGFVANPAGNWTLLAKALTTRTLPKVAPPRWFLKHFVIGGSPPPSLEANLCKALSAADSGVMAARLRAVLACDAREDMARSEIPLMYIQAECDRLVPAECFTVIQRIRPNTTLVSIPGAPHLVLQCEPRKCAETIAHFIQELQLI